MQYAVRPQFPTVRAALAVAMAVLAAGASHGQTLFDDVRVDHPLPSQPDQSVTADFDGNGTLDLALVHMNPGSVTLFLSNPAGDFLPPLPTSVAQSPRGIAAGDVDGDGDVDLAVALSTGSGVRLLLNDGAGNMSLGAVVATAGGSPLDVALANMDGGSDLELVAGSGNLLQVFSNNGSGSFTSLATVATTGFVLHLAAGDLDGDGDIDVAASQMVPAGMLVSMNNGSGSLGAPSYHATGANPQNPCIADVDGDSDNDILVPNTDTGTIGIHLNNGSGVFSAGTGLTGVGSPSAVSAMDMNGDGDLDILVAGQSGGLCGFFVNNGGGVFAPVVLYRATGPAYTVSCGDWGGDGLPDVAFGTDAALSRFAGAGDQLRRCARVSGHSPRAAELADVDADGDLDIVHVATTASQIGVNRNDGSGNFGASEVNGMGTVNSRALLVGDFNGDGSPDVATSGLSGPIAFALNNGSGTFAVQPSLAVPGQTVAMALADFDGDGDPDIASAQFSADVVRLLPNNGAGAFSLGGSTAVSAGPSGLAHGDLDGDGDADLVVSCNGADSVAVLLNNGAGTFSVSSFAVGDGPQRLALGDLDGDGDLDLAVPNENANTLGLYSNNGAGVFTMVSVLPARTGPVQARIADADGDGDNDVLVACASAGRIALFNNFGGFAFGEIAGYEADSFAQSVAVGDVDGNGSPDVIGACQLANNVTILRNSVPTLASVEVVTDSRIVATFSEEVSGADLAAASYVLSGSAKGTFAAQPSSVSASSPGQRMLQWTMGEMFDGGDAIITVTGAMEDARGNKLGHFKSRTHQGGGIGHPPTAAFTSSTGEYTVTDSFDVELTFNEKLDGFSDADLQITGAELQAMDVNEPNYTLHLRAIAEGPVTVTLPAGAYADLAGNAGIATESITVTYDATAPGIALSSTAPDPTNAAITVTATLTEPSSTFGAADISTANSAVSNFAGSGASYSWTLTPSAQGAFSCSVPAATFTDAALHPNTASNSLARTFDSVAPSTLLSTSAPNPTNAPLPFTVTLGEPSTNFEAGDVSVTNGSVTGFSGSGTAYSWTVTPAAQGAVTCSVPSGVYTDAAGNGNTASGVHSRTYDSVAPTISISSTAPAATNTAITVSATLSEPSTNFGAGDVSAVNATVGGFSGSGVSYSWTLTPSAQGGFSCSVPAGGFTDAATNPNAASGVVSRVFDSVAPTIALSTTAPDPTNGAITVNATLSEPSTDFTAADVAPTNAAVSAFTGSGTSYSWTLTPSAQGAFLCIVNSGTFSDAAANANASSSNALSRTFDSVAPTVTLTSTEPDPTNGAITVNATLSEPSATFLASDVEATNASVSGFSGTGASYSWTLTALGQGTFSCHVPAGALEDAAANANTAASNVLARTFDSVPPAISLASTAPAATNGAITVTATLTEASADFDAGDISPVNASVSLFSGSGASYSWTLTPLWQGTFSCQVASGQFSDAAANANTAASNVLSRTFDSVAPAMSLTTVDPTRVGPAPMVIDFSATDAGSGIASGQVFARLLGETAWSPVGAIGGGVGAVDFGPAQDGVYELTMTALDAAGNGVAAPGGPMLSVIYNADGGAFQHTAMGAGTHVFPMTNEIDVELTLLGTPVPAASITVDRVTGDGAPSGLSAPRLIDERLVISGALNSATASVKWPFDPASAVGLIGAIEAVFQVEGGAVTGQFPATVAGGAIEFGPVTSFSEWWAGNQPSSVEDWTLMEARRN